ncbi:MAG: hypothetical protein AB7G93_12825 [Bdellovibrionales bacterium]
MRLYTYALAGLIAFAASSAFASYPPSRKVQYGGTAELDACGGSGIILTTTTLFRIKGSDTYWTFDKANVNQMAALCDEEDGYYGVVFSERGNECGTGTPVSERKDYDGPCKSGWIKKEFFELLAG